jgi:hypothetical protein
MLEIITLQNEEIKRLQRRVEDRDKKIKSVSDALLRSETQKLLPYKPDPVMSVCDVFLNRTFPD